MVSVKYRYSREQNRTERDRKKAKGKLSAVDLLDSSSHSARFYSEQMNPPPPFFLFYIIHTEVTGLVMKRQVSINSSHSISPAFSAFYSYHCIRNRRRGKERTGLC